MKDETLDRHHVAQNPPQCYIGRIYTIESCPLDPTNQLSLAAAELLIKYDNATPPIPSKYLAEQRRGAKLHAAVRAGTVIGAILSVPCIEAPADLETREGSGLARWRQGDPLTVVFDYALDPEQRAEPSANFQTTWALLTGVAEVAIQHENDLIVTSTIDPAAAETLRLLGFEGADNDLFVTPQQILTPQPPLTR